MKKQVNPVLAFQIVLMALINQGICVRHVRGHVKNARSAQINAQHASAH
jgi:hypothetical protein